MDKFILVCNIYYMSIGMFCARWSHYYIKEHIIWNRFCNPCLPLWKHITRHWAKQLVHSKLSWRFTIIAFFYWCIFKWGTISATISFLWSYVSYTARIVIELTIQATLAQSLNCFHGVIKFFLFSTSSRCKLEKKVVKTLKH